MLERISMGWLGQFGYSRKFPIKLWLTFYLGFVLYICDFDIKISIFQNPKFDDILVDMLTSSKGEWRKIYFLVDEVKSVYLKCTGIIGARLEFRISVSNDFFIDALAYQSLIEVINFLACVLLQA